MTKSILITSWLYLLTLVFIRGHAQNPATVFQLDRLPKDGVMLDRGWRFHQGDNPTWANPELDDRQWAWINPTKAIQDVPQIQRAGISWLRLRITTGQELPPVVCYMFQSVASDVYLDGRLLYRFGHISTNPDSVRAYNPYAAFSLPLQPATQHILAIRLAYQPNLDYEKIYLGRLPSAVRFHLFPAAEIPAIPLFNIESVYLDSFKVGLAFILFILHLSLFIVNRHQRANLYAAGMYGMMGYQSALRAASDLMHSLEARTILGYSSYASPWISGLMLLVFYKLFDLRKGLLFCLTIGTIGLTQFSLPSGYSWLTILISYWLTVELIRVSALAIHHHQPGARTVLAGVIIHVSLSIVLWIIFTYNVPINGHEWLYHGLYMLMFLCLPLALSLRLSLEHGWINKLLSVKLQEVEDLSAQNLAQQKYREKLLSRQNEELEHQVEERTEELRQQASQLKELDEAKSRFFTNLTHEFRTPLSLILAPVKKLLESTTLPDTQHTMLQTVDRNARHLLNQVNQLLDLSRLEDGHVQVVRQPIRLGQLTAHLVDLFESPAQAGEIALTFTTEGSDNVCMMDTDKWSKIVYNLLSNALKFTPAGGQVNIWLNAEIDPIQFLVNDTGIGIDTNKLPFIFDRFYQADDHLTRRFEGTGIGLALVRELTVLLGGHLTVTSQPGVATTFRLTLPRPPVSADVEPLAATVPRPVAVQRLLNSPIYQLPNPSITAEDDRVLVLVVEDNAELQAFMFNELSGRYRVLKADNGEAGWEVVRQHLPDIVISDLMMPQMHGLRLTHLIKSTFATNHIAVVLLTARSNHESRLEGLRQGADEYLVKPFDLTELRLRLANMVARQQTLQRYYRQQIEQPNVQRSTDLQLPTDPFLERIYVLLEDQLNNPKISVEWLADQLSMDRKTLYRKLQSKLQLSPNTLIRLYRLRRSSELLRAGRAISDVAYSVGFESVTYFGQCFKEQYGMTPSEFKAQGVLP